MNRPPVWTQITAFVNALIWRMPLPNRLRARFSAVVYRNPWMGIERVVETLDALAAAGVVACCMGGWGVDALIGEQSRKHRDLDLIIEQRDRDAALRALTGIGYEKWYEHHSEESFGDRVVVRDRCRRVVDIHPFKLEETDLVFVSGTIGGRTVTCLSAEQQVRANQGFRKRLLHERRSQRSNQEIARRVLDTESSSIE